MSYDATVSQPVKLSDGLGGGGATAGRGQALWSYISADADSDVDASDYFSNGDDLGMKEGDIVFLYDTANDVGSVMYVTAVTAGGAATVAFAKVA